METTRKDAVKIRFLFNEKGFRLDSTEDIYTKDNDMIEILRWREAFEKEPYYTLYELGFQEKPNWLDAAGRYLYYLADCFLQTLTHQPDIELLRENVTIVPERDVMEGLLNAVPFTLGSEYVTEKWILEIFRQLKNQYAEEIRQYEGTVAL